jgi:predicted DNA-binding protein (MmcQ/YjbR family)
MDKMRAKLAFAALRPARFVMNIDQLRKLCLGLPGATEQIQWKDDLLFKVGGKMFAITPLEPARLWLCIKADPEEFTDLTERLGIIPAPYLARAKWIAVESPGVLSRSEVEALVRKSYELVAAKLPRRVRESLFAKVTPRATRKKKTTKQRKQS